MNMYSKNPEMKYAEEDGWGGGAWLIYLKQQIKTRFIYYIFYTAWYTKSNQKNIFALQTFRGAKLFDLPIPNAMFPQPIGNNLFNYKIYWLLFFTSTCLDNWLLYHVPHYGREADDIFYFNLKKTSAASYYKKCTCSYILPEIKAKFAGFLNEH